MTKTFLIFACLFSFTTSVGESTKFTLLLLPESTDISSSAGTTGTCMGKKISGKISPVPRLKCRFS